MGFLYATGFAWGGCTADTGVNKAQRRRDAEAQRRRDAETQRRALAWRSIGTNRRNPHAVAVAVARLVDLALVDLALVGLSLSVYWLA